MVKRLLWVFVVLMFSNCIVKKKTTYNKPKTVTVSAGNQPRPIAINTTKASKKVNAVVKSALRYTGTRYRFGGSTKKGMDCSGLVYTALLENDITFPRVSYHMAEQGKKIGLRQVQKGDLLFFKTAKTRRRVNHVGMVVKVDSKGIQFIHSTSSRGVIVSSLKEGYWNSAFVKATRIL